MQQPRPPQSVTLWLLRIAATLWLAQLIMQVTFAAAFVSGDTGVFQLHSINGSLMSTLPFIMILLALLHATVARGRVWPLPVSIFLVLLCGTQAILGYTRVIGAHIVGGTALLAIATLWCVGLWRHRYRPRQRKPRPAAQVRDVPPVPAPTGVER